MTIFYLILAAIAGAIAGGVFGFAWLGVIAALCLLFIWQTRQQYILLRWVHKGAKGTPPDLSGPLSEVVTLLAKQRKQGRKRKRKLQLVLKSFRELAEAVPEAALITNEAGYIINFNKPAQRLFNLNPKLDIGAQIHHLIRHPAFEAFWHNNNEASVVMEFSSDENYYLEFARVNLSQGNVLVMAQDITRMMLLDKKRKAFVDNASHELKTPLTVISGFLEIMRAGDIPAKWQVPVAEMSNHTARMNELVEDMLRLAQLESLEHKLNESEIELLPFLQRVATFAEQRCPDGVGVCLGYVPSLTLKADNNLLLSMLTNLVINALLHANSRHAVELSAALTEEHFLISVVDDGIGIAPEHISRIDERFYRIDDNRIGRNGSGLGLAIVKHGIEAHGGSLDIRSTLDVGSTFVLTFPLSRVV